MLTTHPPSTPKQFESLQVLRRIVAHCPPSPTRGYATVRTAGVCTKRSFWSSITKYRVVCIFVRNLQKQFEIELDILYDCVLVHVIVRECSECTSLDMGLMHSCTLWKSSFTINVEITRSTQRAQTSAERQQSSESGFQTSDSWIRTVFQIVTKIYPLGPWAIPYPSTKIRQTPFTTFSVIRRTARQTDRSENRPSFGGGNKPNINYMWCDNVAPTASKDGW